MVFTLVFTNSGSDSWNKYPSGSFLVYENSVVARKFPTHDMQRNILITCMCSRSAGGRMDAEQASSVGFEIAW